ncbi:MAG: HAMP domain-containing sensor histidine kinase, partial [Alphaproteobacteria bacterium]
PRRWAIVVLLLALGLAFWVYQVAAELAEPAPAYWLFLALTLSLIVQPLLFRLTGAYGLLSTISVLILNAMTLVAVYNFGGHLSPALPISIVIPLFCLFFLSNPGQVIGLSTLAASYCLLITLYVNGHAWPQYLAGQDLAGMFLAGVIVAAVLVTAMARAYLDLSARSGEVLRAEILAHRDTADNLAKAQNQVAQVAKSKGRSIAAICDEVRMPLNAIIGFAQFISRELMGQVSDQRYRSCASDIESSGRHLLGVIDEVLDLVRVQTGDLELVDGDFEFAQMIDKCCETVNGLAHARHVELTRELPAGGLNVRADHSRMRQVTIALLSNCIALVGSRGRVHVQLSQSARGQPMLLIRATGSTVSPERMALALEPFDGLPTGHGAERLGIGYGLPIVRRLVELHGGELLVGGPKADETHIILTLPAERLL